MKVGLKKTQRRIVIIKTKDKKKLLKQAAEYQKRISPDSLEVWVEK